MDRVFLGVMCSGLVALVTAFALATPNIKQQRAQPDDAMLVHLLQHPASVSASAAAR
jgi:hypothetical protein